MRYRIMSLAMLVALSWITGCRGCMDYKPDPNALSTALSLRAPCRPTDPDCDPGSGTNGPGVYASDGHDFYLPSGRIKLRRMVTTFINSTDGTANVGFKGFVQDATGAWVDYRGTIAAAQYGGNPVEVVAIHAQSSAVSVRIKQQATEITGGALGQLWLQLRAAPPLEDVYWLHFSAPEPDPDKAALSVYVAEIATGPGAPGSPMCRDTAAAAVPVSLVEGQYINPFTGAQTLSDKAVTISCVSGAIHTCLRWGYQPWARRNNESLAPAHAACIQMKRASYCGDWHSYTTTGTPLALADRYGIQAQGPALPGLEAVWSPAGATCLNPSQRRHPEIPFTPQCGIRPLLPCPSPPALWWITGYTADVKK